MGECWSWKRTGCLKCGLLRLWFPYKSYHRDICCCLLCGSANRVAVQFSAQAIVASLLTDFIFASYLVLPLAAFKMKEKI